MGKLAKMGQIRLFFLGVFSYISVAVWLADFFLLHGVCNLNVWENSTQEINRFLHDWRAAFSFYTSVFKRCNICIWYHTSRGLNRRIQAKAALTLEVLCVT